MEKKSFRNVFLLHTFIITLLILGSTAFNDYLTSDEEYENFKVLITAEEGLQFSKEDSPGGRKIIYDCKLGLSDSGFIRIFDKIHPQDMKSLTIKNCYNLTVIIAMDNTNIKYEDLQELKITNVTLLQFKPQSGCWGCSGYRTYPVSEWDFRVSISNVQFLDIGQFFNEMKNRILSLKLQNVGIDTLQDLVTDYRDREHKVVNLHLKNVKINKIKSRALYLEGNSNILTIEDSHFKNIQSGALVFQGEVKITNNTFDFLDEGAFSINTSSSFLFSGNHVKRLVNPFNITAFEINIVNNTFDSITAPWLPKIESSVQFFRILNITGNIMNNWSHNLFYLDPKHSDVIIFEGNYLNCSCKNAIILTYKTQNYITEIFLNKQHQNFCHNLGNCPLHKALKLESGICSGSFRCPEDQNEDEDGRMWPSHIKSILSVLKNIDIKLDQIAAKYNSPLADKPN